MATEAAPTRRAVLARAALGLGLLACSRAAGQPAEAAAYAAIETAATGASRLRLLDAGGGPAGLVALDGRAHGMARHAATLAVFPRRPGTRFALVDLGTLAIRAVVDAPGGRHFFGHGAFAADGRTLLVTENDLATLGGAIGVYAVDPSSARRLETIPLPRPGPHDLARIPGTDRFEVALGGLETHPAYGRAALNRDAFASEVVVLDLARGDPARPDGMGLWPGAEGVSLRHLARDGRGRLVVGGQRADPARAAPGGVLWLVEDGRAVRLDPADRLGGYVSSVAARGDAALATSKETGRVLRLEGGAVAGEWRLDGASAAALGARGPIASGYVRLGLGPAAVDAAPGHEFDNHGLALL